MGEVNILVEYLTGPAKGVFHFSLLRHAFLQIPLLFP